MESLATRLLVRISDDVKVSLFFDPSMHAKMKMIRDTTYEILLPDDVYVLIRKTSNQVAEFSVFGE